MVPRLAHRTAGALLYHRRVPLLRRRLLPLLSIAALAGGLAAPAAHAQSAGDEQYQDPFDSSGSQGSSKPEPKPAPAAQAPSTSSGSTTAQATATAPAATAAASADPAAAGELPRTGLDTRVALVAGLTLLLLGLALRRRTHPDRCR